MIAHLKYLRYLLRHKWFVLVAGLRLGVSLWQLLVHDWSKVLPSEWFPYVQQFYGRAQKDDHARDAVKLAFQVAWLRHQHRNLHHWQHWVLRNDDGSERALPMPERYVREMVADWMGAGRAIHGRWEAREWYAKNGFKMTMHVATLVRVKALLRDHGLPDLAVRGMYGSSPSTAREDQ